MLRNSPLNRLSGLAVSKLRERPAKHVNQSELCCVGK